MEIVTGLPKVQNRGQKEFSIWDEVFTSIQNGDTVKLSQVEDFPNSTAASFRSQIITKARKRGLKISTRIIGGDEVYVQLVQ